MRTLHENLPGLKLVISCAPNDRERGKLEDLLKQLPFTPWKVFAGNLNLLDLVSVQAGARLHLGGDSGGVHLAVMANAPTVSWFRSSESVQEWMPTGGCHRALISSDSGEDAVRGITLGELVLAVTELLGR
jgi:ADP-heptose:LPS heptosyltransferase